MKILNSHILISAPAEKIWGILMDFPRYPEWNPFIKTITGNPKVGERIAAFLQPSGQRGMMFKPRVQVAQAAREFRWLGHFLVPGILDGEHVFRLEPAGGNQTRFSQDEYFRGVLVPLLWNQLNTHTRRGFEEMNTALKARAESAV